MNTVLLVSSSDFKTIFTRVTKYIIVWLLICTCVAILCTHKNLEAEPLQGEEEGATSIGNWREREENTCRNRGRGETERRVT